MSDSRLRDLERGWRRTGSLRDEAAYLQEQLRAGELERTRLELAAYCGHEPAQLALAAEAPTELELDAWIAGLQPQGGVEALRRAALAAAEFVLQHWCDPPEGPTDADPFDALPGSTTFGEVRDDTAATWEEARNFVLCPCRPHVPRMPIVGVNPPRPYALLANLVGIGWPPSSVDAVHEALWRLRGSDLPDAASELRGAIREALVPWALGRGDPLRVGWATPVSRLGRDELLAAAQEVAELLGGSDPVTRETLAHRVVRRQTGEKRFRLRVGNAVLDPGLLEALRTRDAEAAVERALAFEPASEDTPELLRFLEFYTHRQRTVDGTTHDFAWFYAEGWRELMDHPGLNREPVTGEQ